MMVPFVDREVPAARTWLYQPETAARHPLAAVRVRNDGESGLPPPMRRQATEASISSAMHRNSVFFSVIGEIDISSRPSGSA